MKKWRRRIGWAFAVLLLLAALLAWEGRAVAMIRFTGNAHRPALNHDFSRLGELLPGKGPVLTEMYSGLPHPFHEGHEFVRELWTTRNRSIRGYRFYQKATIPSVSVQSLLVDILSKKESFRAYQGPKMCGGYHADFAAKLESGGESTWFLVCLGCGEVLIYSKDQELICEIESKPEGRLQEAWKDHRGVPFKTFGTRLPVKESSLAAWGVGAQEAWNPMAIEESRTGLGGYAFVRQQRLNADSGKREPEERIGSLRLSEETYESAEYAQQRATNFSIAWERAMERGKTPPPEEGFVFENRFYRIAGKDERSRDEVRRLLDLLRFYCAEQAPHDVRFYD